MYTLDGLKHGIERCEHNIEVLKKALADERQTIADYKIMMSQIEEAEKKKAEAEANVHIEVDDGSQD